MISQPQHRRGFTLIEVLVVIGIILILIGLFFVGMKVIGRSAGSNATKVNLERLRGMMAELETSGSLRSRQPVQMWFNQMLVAPGNIWQDADPATAGDQSIEAPGDVSMDQWDASSPSDAASKHTRDRFQSEAVCNTQLVMQLMLQLPNNRQAFNNFSQETLLKNPDQGKQSASHSIKAATGPTLILAAATPPETGAITPPVPLDAFGNPIIFVPSAGMNVAAPYSATESYKQGRIVINSAKLYRSIKATGGTPTTDTNVWEELPPAYNAVVTSPERRPYFVSAGPDGDFRTPDDNVYSFE
jgi:prepilin-type N-terminal cleavage/methylation domain-containing protein